MVQEMQPMVRKAKYQGNLLGLEGCSSDEEYEDDEIWEDSKSDKRKGSNNKSSNNKTKTGVKSKKGRSDSTDSSTAKGELQYRGEKLECADSGVKATIKGCREALGKLNFRDCWDTDVEKFAQTANLSAYSSLDGNAVGNSGRNNARRPGAGGPAGDFLRAEKQSTDVIIDGYSKISAQFDDLLHTMHMLLINSPAGGSDGSKSTNMKESPNKGKKNQASTSKSSTESADDSTSLHLEAFCREYLSVIQMERSVVLLARICLKSDWFGYDTLLLNPKKSPLKPEEGVRFCDLLKHEISKIQQLPLECPNAGEWETAETVVNNVRGEGILL
jgi:hypothetical protein